ncbi:hypothetical protein KIL84_006698 [Mauremys mutica]|uniref:Uncharacterized protein n=1 Tax=Mauremys mutica TaxID=74926 RepID=A0A9D3X1Z1_9SAUR|nr:hypothetical protein KIL84_006698 [Mauremys mutica]
MGQPPHHTPHLFSEDEIPPHPPPTLPTLGEWGGQNPNPGLVHGPVLYKTLDLNFGDVQNPDLRFCELVSDSKCPLNRQLILPFAAKPLAGPSGSPALLRSDISIQVAVSGVGNGFRQYIPVYGAFSNIS